MNSHNDAGIRLKLGGGFLKEAEEDFQLGRWRSCVDNAQLAAENSAKAVIALYEPPEKSHEPGEQFLRVSRQYPIAVNIRKKLEKLAGLAGLLGWEVHVLSDYGDASTGRLPWEIYGKKEASMALKTARSVFVLAGELIGS